MTNKPETFLNRFQNVSATGDQYICRCPAHNDKKASLAVKFTQEGKVLLHCHAGCETKAVVKAAGLEMKDLGGCDIDAFSSPENGVHLSTPAESIETNGKNVDNHNFGVDTYVHLKRLPEDFWPS